MVSRRRGNEPVRLEEIVVTAQKRSENLQGRSHVGNGVAARRAHRPESDIDERLPGQGSRRFIQTIRPGAETIGIRGIIGGASGNPVSGITIDDVPFGSSTYLGGGGGLHPDLDPSILSSIEVLKGPQGTLYGASSIGGLIKYETRTPSLTDRGGAIESGR